LAHNHNDGVLHMFEAAFNWIMTNGTLADLIIIAMGVPVAWLAITNRKSNRSLTDKYHQIDKLTLVHSWIINLKLGVKTVKQHRNGDYEIANPIDVIDD